MLHDLTVAETVAAIDALLRELKPGDYQRKSWSFEKIKSMIESQREIVASADFQRIEDSVKSTSYQLVDSFDWQDPLYPVISRSNAMANHLVRRWKRDEFESDGS